jgi:hypothetical protein
MSETETEFLARMAECYPFNPNWRPGDSVRLDMLDFARLFALARRGAAADAEIERLRAALRDLLSWFPDEPTEPEWRLKAGEYGADDALEAARAALEVKP